MLLYIYTALYNTKLLTHQFQTVQCFNSMPWLSDCQSSAEVYYSSGSQLTRGKLEYFV